MFARTGTRKIQLSFHDSLRDVAITTNFGAKSAKWAYLPRQITMLTPTSQFLQARCPAWHLTNSIEALKNVKILTLKNTK